MDGETTSDRGGSRSNNQNGAAPTAWSQLTPEEADSRVAQSVCFWHQPIHFNPVIDGIDFSVIIRQHLWPVVAAAAQQLNGLPAFETFLRQHNLSATVPHRNPVTTYRSLTQRTLRWSASRPSAMLRRLQGRSRILVPFPHWTWQRTWSAIRAAGHATDVEPPVLHRVRRQRLHGGLQDESRDFCSHVIRGLAAFGIDVSQQQLKQLTERISAAFANVSLARQQLSKRPPACLVTNTSATSPTIEYILTARSLNIPTVAIQYGLDCDRFAYDDAHADFVAVWSDHRRHDYQQRSTRAPKEITVTGNPEYDGTIPLPKQHRGTYWLWVTRPHSPQRCKLASEDPTEGIRILQTLLLALRQHPEARLVIKPHPNDYPELYRQLLEQDECGPRVSILTKPLKRLLPQAAVVFTEDTTAGIDAIRFACPLIHVRLLPTDPILPFSAMGAAEPAFSREQLLSAIDRSETEDLRPQQARGQQEFLSIYGGSPSGATAKLCAFLSRAASSATVTGAVRDGW